MNNTIIFISSLNTNVRYAFRPFTNGGNNINI